MTLCHDCRQPFESSLNKQMYCQGCRTGAFRFSLFHRMAPRSKELTDEEVLYIRSSKIAVKRLSNRLGISTRTIRSIQAGRTYADVKRE